MAARRLTSGLVAGKVCVGVVTGARGVRGEVRVKSFTAEPADLDAYGPVTDESGTRTFRLKVTGTAKDQLLVRIDGVADRTAAEALKGVQFYVPRAALPEPEDDEFYHADLIGLRAELTDGTDLGTVKTVHDFGAGDVLEIGRPEGVTVLVPFTRAVVPEVDLEAGRLVIDPPEGLLDEAETDEEDGIAG